MRIRVNCGVAIAFIFCFGMWCTPYSAGAHCGTLDGPVIIAAKAALEKNDVTPVLKWVKGDEGQIRELLKKTISVRSKGAEA